MARWQSGKPGAERPPAAPRPLALHPQGETEGCWGSMGGPWVLGASGGAELCTQGGCAGGGSDIKWARIGCLQHSRVPISPRRSQRRRRQWQRDPRSRQRLCHGAGQAGAADRTGRHGTHQSDPQVAPVGATSSALQQCPWLGCPPQLLSRLPAALTWICLLPSGSDGNTGDLLPAVRFKARALQAPKR